MPCCSHWRSRAVTVWGLLGGCLMASSSTTSSTSKTTSSSNKIHVVSTGTRPDCPAMPSSSGASVPCTAAVPICGPPKAQPPHVRRIDNSGCWPVPPSTLNLCSATTSRGCQSVQLALPSPKPAVGLATAVFLPHVAQLIAQFATVAPATHVTYMTTKPPPFPIWLRTRRAPKAKASLSPPELRRLPQMQ